MTLIAVETNLLMEGNLEEMKPINENEEEDDVENENAANKKAN